MTKAKSPVVSMVLAVLVVLSGSAAAQTARGPAGAPVPEAWDYVRLTPEERYQLRQNARALNAEQRAEHNRYLREEISRLPDWIYAATHYEKVAMDCERGTYLPLAAPALMDAWDYVKRSPHQRHDSRLAARALDPQARAVYDAHMATELARLPDWLQAALVEEGELQDQMYGLDPCPGVAAAP